MRYPVESVAAVGVGVLLGALAKPPGTRHVLFTLGLAVAMGMLETAATHFDAQRQRPELPRKSLWLIPSMGLFVGLFSVAPVVFVVALIVYGVRRLLGA